MSQLKGLTQNFLKTSCTFPLTTFVAIPLLEECEDDIHIPEMGTWESFETPKIFEFDCRGQNTSP